MPNPTELACKYAKDLALQKVITAIREGKSMEELEQYIKALMDDK